MHLTNFWQKLFCSVQDILFLPEFFFQLLSSSWVFLAFDPLLLGLLGGGWLLSPLWGLWATPLMVTDAYHDGVAVQVCDLAADHDEVSAKLLWQYWPNCKTGVSPRVYLSFFFVLFFLYVFCAIISFPTCGPNRTQVCSHIIGYIPVPIGLLFAIAQTHDWTGNGATQTCTWVL